MRPGQILNGKSIANTWCTEIAQTIQDYVAAGRRRPGLAVIKVGGHQASEIYVRHKIRACEKVNIASEVYELSDTSSEADLIALIQSLNRRHDIDGILVQLPLPDGFTNARIVETIAVEKDIDGFHPYNLGRLCQKNPTLRPCTPWGIMRLLGAINAAAGQGREAVIVGASNIVGRPIAMELLLARYTVTITHSLTPDLAAHVNRADLVVVAVGRPQFIPGSWIKPGAIVIDVGINRLPDGRLLGDVDFDAALQRAAWITPVPGGVGPMTVAALLHNTLHAYEQRNGYATYG